MKTIPYLFLASATGLASLASIFCAFVSAFGISVSDPRLALFGWLGMLWFAVCAVWFIHHAIRRDR